MSEFGYAANASKSIQMSICAIIVNAPENSALPELYSRIVNKDTPLST